MEARTALRIFGICGIISVLVDLDHFISLFIWQYINPQITSGRIWHAPLLIISCCFICYLVSYLRGFYSKLVLGIIILITVMTLVFGPFVTWGLYE